MDLGDIQGLVLRSYRRLPYARYVLLRFVDNPALVQRWLAAFVQGQRIDSAVSKESGPVGSPDVRLNIAFTYSGLEALGVDTDALDRFPLEFVEGLGAPWEPADQPDHRSRILGDVGESRPDEWIWGYQDGDRAVDALLLAFARHPNVLDTSVGAWIYEAEVTFGAIAQNTAVILKGHVPADPVQPNHEPFGFVDGISQPILKGATAHLGHGGRPKQPLIQIIEDGEILLGHRDGKRMRSESPTVAPESDPHDILPVSPVDNGRHDLGFNGTYLVFRQLAQDVEWFHRACARAAASVGLTREHLEAFVVGRWHDGAPLISAPIAHDPQLDAPPAANDFTYAFDPYGERCPMGAHIRRANPRDVLDDDSQSESLQVTNRHRILRRARPYDDQDRKERGLHFIALNGGIARQFEFIQQNWINNPAFNGLTEEDDPMVGPRQGPGSCTKLTLPPPPESRIARRVDGLMRFVTVRGGGYFFLPSLTALGYLAQAAPAPARPSRWRAALPAPSWVDRVRAFALSRFTFMFALLLAAAPLAIRAPGVALVVRPTFDLDRPGEILVVAMLAALTAAGLQMTFRLVHLYSERRFGVRTTASPLTWRVVFMWQALSLPIVGTAWWRSACDAAIVSRSLARELAAFGGAAAAGYVLAFVLLQVAARVRVASVRPAHAADAVLLPFMSTPPRPDVAPPTMARLLAPVTGFFETRAARLPPTAGAGYVDPKTGHILPGHLTLLAFVATLSFVYVAGWFLFSPLGRFQLPPLAYVLFVVLVAALVTSGAAFFLDKFRVPLLTVLLVWVVLASLLGGTDHEFPVQSHLDAAPAVAAAIERADAHQRASGGPGDGPIVVVAAAGGGIRQAAWTTRVLTGLTELYGEAFSANLRLISGVSAGSVGALPFLNAYTETSPPRGDLLPLLHVSETSASGDIWWGLVYGDAVRVVISYPPRRLFPRTLDRGWALEQALQRASGFQRVPPPTLSGWRRDVGAGWRPAVAFNATMVETGERVVLATYEVPRPPASPPATPRPFDRATATDGTLDASEVTGGHDLSVFTAARLSSAFPYVTPVARLDQADQEPGDKRAMRHLADGGYWDNTGMVSAIEWLTAAGVLGHRRVLVVQVAPATLGEPIVRDRAWVWQSIAPLSTLVSVRTDAESAYNTLDIKTMKDRWGDGLVFATIRDPATDASLGWHLSRREKSDLELAWRNKAANPCGPELSAITAFLENPSSPSRGCGQ